MLIDPTTLYEYALSCTYFNFNHHLRTVNQLHYWCFNFRTVKTTTYRNALFPFGCTAFRRVAVKKWKFYVRRRKYRGPIMMMVLFRIGLATFYIGFLLNIFFSPLVAFFALILAVSVIFSQKITINTLE
jgi:hypothetical protein